MNWMWNPAEMYACIGSDLVTKFFGGNPERAIEKIIKINGIPFRVIGTMESKGSSIGRSFDNVVITSYNNVRRFFVSGSVNFFNPAPSFNIQVKVPDVNQMRSGNRGSRRRISSHPENKYNRCQQFCN